MNQTDITIYAALNHLTTKWKSIFLTSILLSLIVIFFSLFTDSLLNYETKIIDPYFNQVVFYNINSVNKIEEIGEKYKFKLINNDKFEIKKKLEKNID